MKSLLLSSNEGYVLRLEYYYPTVFQTDNINTNNHIEQYCDFVFHPLSKIYVFQKYENTLMLHLTLLNQMDQSTQLLNLYFYNKPNVFQGVEYHLD